MNYYRMKAAWEMDMQATLIHVEHARVVGAERSAAESTPFGRVPPRRRREVSLLRPRRGLAALLARAAWRLDRDALSAARPTRGRWS
jgi:hypothetical protein